MKQRGVITRVVRVLGATPVGLSLIGLFAVYAALGTLPLFPAPSGVGTDRPVPARMLAWIDKTEGEYFAWWPSVSLLVGIVVSMTVSMLTRVAWRWCTAPVLLTHGGVVLLALGSAVYAAQKQEGEVVLHAPEVDGAEVGPEVREMVVRGGRGSAPIPGVSVALREVRIETVPGTDVARRVTAMVRAVAGGVTGDHGVTLNQPLVLEGLPPPVCDCVVRGTLERVWHGWINPVRWKFSIAGWDHEGWLLSREAVIAGMAERPVAGFVVLGVGNTPGVRIIAAGALVMLLGMAGGVLLRTAPATYRSGGEARRGGEAVAAPSPARGRGARVVPGVALAVVGFFSPGVRGAEIDAVSSLRTLPVEWNGRIAALDTVARDIVRAASGRERAPGKGRAAPREDPLVTLLDLALRPEENLDRPLVSASGVRGKAWMGGAPSDPSGLLTLREAEAGLGRFVGLRADGAGLSEATRLAERVAVARLGFRALAMVAPDGSVPGPGRDDWLDAESERAPPPIRAAVERLRDVWRGGDTGAVVVAANHLSSVLRAHNAGRYDAARVWVEVLHNRLGLLELAAWGYGIAAALLLVSLLVGWGVIGGWGQLVVGGAWALHAAGFGLRWYVAGRAPIQNQYESMIALALLVVLAVGAAGAARWLKGRPAFDDPDDRSGPGRWGVAWFAAALVAAVVMAASEGLPVPGRIIEPEAAILGTAALLKYHVTTVLAAYALIALAGVTGAVWLGARLWAGPRPRGVRGGPAGPHDPPAEARGGFLADLGGAVRGLCFGGFCVLTLGILLGALWADRAWGRWWAFDPKETWALITWMVMLAAVHVRRDAEGARAVLAVAGLAVMTWSWFGVNLLLPGLHAYAGN